VATIGSDTDGRPRARKQDNGFQLPDACVLKILLHVLTVILKH
jgi:hypothetical protein